MALVSTLIADALGVIGVLAPGETVAAEDQATGLRHLQYQLDAWQADRLTMSRQLRTVFTLPNGANSVTLGPTGTVVMDRPTWVNGVNFIVPGATPDVESPIYLYDQDSYANTAIKLLPSSLPVGAFYQTNLTDGNGTLIFWPQVTQNVQIALYTPQGIAVPASVNTVLIGPPGYAEAFLYQLAFRLCLPFGVSPPDLLVEMERRATMAMKRPNIRPGLLGVDVALVAWPGRGYNIYSDTTNTR